MFRASRLTATTLPRSPAPVTIRPFTFEGTAVSATSGPTHKGMPGPGVASEPSGHLPLSVRLARLVEGSEAAEGMTLNQLMVRTEGRGFFLIMVFASLPFVIPVSLPGLSTFMGLIIGVLGGRLALGKPPRLPRLLGERLLKPRTTQKMLKASTRFLRFLEKLIRPRRTKWLSTKTAMLVNGLLIVFMALLLALPVPPVVLFTNSLPSYAVILLAVSIMEEDGVTIWLGYLMCLVSTIYFVLIAGVVWVSLSQGFETLMRKLGGGS